MTAMLLAGGIGLLGFGLAELVWFVRAAPARWFATQAMMFAELGLLFLATALMREGPARTAVGAFLGLSVLVSSVILVAQARRERRGGRASV